MTARTIPLVVVQRAVRSRGCGCVGGLLADGADEPLALLAREDEVRRPVGRAVSGLATVEEDARRVGGVDIFPEEAFSVLLEPGVVLDGRQEALSSSVAPWVTSLHEECTSGSRGQPGHRLLGEPVGIPGLAGDDPVVGSCVGAEEAPVLTFGPGALHAVFALWICTGLAERLAVLPLLVELGLAVRIPGPVEDHAGLTITRDRDQVFGQSRRSARLVAVPCVERVRRVALGSLDARRGSVLGPVTTLGDSSRDLRTGQVGVRARAPHEEGAQRCGGKGSQCVAQYHDVLAGVLSLCSMCTVS